MYTNQDTESELSVAYLQAIAAHNRFSCAISPRTMDNNGIDATLHGLDSFGGLLTEITLHVQLKATVKEPAIQDGKISFFLDSIALYNKLRSTTVSVPKILVVLFLPKEQPEWLKHSPDELCIRKCAYWVSLKGAHESTNQSGVTVYIPESQALSPEELRRIFESLSHEKDLMYAT